MKPGRMPRGPKDLGPIRERMIAETSYFLGEAMRGRIVTPRIPTRKVSEGGFSMLRNHPLGRLLARHFWRNWCGTVENQDRG